ncbi:SDR family oxidoreductase [Methylovirgula sp. 4M-Z18]|uniref:SDR family oxidoreductase n=1 Tax=Methylovirgula sp. 4M-Z18 TaxID=2293567 RepID=UPI000E2FDD15|nr:SDR family oxidoreductase [Methylovirgula sp. 4M-Z18]RFB79052.1 SDR family NAD(P)-dependent oxidoreductase [Methylovirgula sp. 4M-Z18]
MSQAFHLDNRVVLVTGATRGIGAATVRELLKFKVKKIYAGARNPDGLPQFNDPRVVPLQLDITDPQSVTKARAVAADVDVLINNAGTAVLSHFLDSSEEVLGADINTNYVGTLRVTRAFAPAIVAKGGGLIANVISVVGLTSAPSLSGYSASKAALHSQTQALRTQLKASNVQVLGIYPGPVETELARDIQAEKASPESVAQEIVAGIKAGETYIFPDQIAKHVGQLWANDGRILDTALVREA